MNKYHLDLKMEIQNKNSQREMNLEKQNLGERSGVLDASISNRIQEIEERVSGAEGNIENNDTTVKKKCKMQKSS